MANADSIKVQVKGFRPLFLKLTFPKGPTDAVCYHILNGLFTYDRVRSYAIFYFLNWSIYKRIGTMKHLLGIWWGEE